jgi:hypothetical protein
MATVSVAFGDWILRITLLLREIIQRQDHLARQNNLILATLGATSAMETKMVKKLDDLEAEVTEIGDVQEATGVIIDHAVDLLGDLKARLEEAGTDSAQLAKIVADLDRTGAALAAKRDALAEAVTTNTPVEPSQA